MRELGGDFDRRVSNRRSVCIWGIEAAAHSVSLLESPIMI